MESQPAAAPINPLVAGLGSPPIPEAQGWLRRYDGGLGPLLDLSQAAPGYPPHPDLLERLAAAAAAPGVARYGPILGDSELRAAYARHVSSLYGAALRPDDVAITAGCNLAFFAAALLLARHGDSVLLPAPWYFNHEMTLATLGVEARPLPCRAESGFVPDPDTAAGLIDDRTRAIVLVTPNNPTGAIYPAATIEAFADLCRARRIWLVVDETYRDFLPDGASRPHALLARPEWRDHLIQLYSFSKSYGIPGHRTGAIVAGDALVRQIGKILDSVQICAPRAAQAALPWAVDGLAGWREDNRRAINARARVFSQALAETPGWRVEALGAYFAYVRHPFTGLPGARVAEALAAERGVLVLPGSFFGPGQEDHVRIAFANVDRDGLAELPRRLTGWSPAR